MSEHNLRQVLPMPDIPPAGLTTYDAKDPDTSYPPIVPLRPAEGRAERAHRADRRRRLRRLERLRRPVPHAELRAPGGQRSQVHALPHHRAVLADAVGPADRPQPPLRGHGEHRRAGDVGARQQLDLAEHRRAARAGPQPQRLQHRPVRQVPRGAGLGDQPDGPVSPVADREGLRVLLRLPRRRDQPVVPGDLRGDDAGRAPQDARGGLLLQRRPVGPRDQVDAPAEGADARQAVLRLLRARRHARPAPRARRVGRQVQGRLRPGLGRAARADLRAPEGAGRDPGRRGPDRAQRRHPGVGRHRRRAQARARPPDGDLRRLPGEHRPPRRPAARRARGPEDPRRHAGLRDHRRQRRLGRGVAAGHVQRDDHARRVRRAGDGRVHVLQDRQVRRARGLQPLRGRLGARDGHAVPVDQAGRLALRRHPQRDDRALAARHQLQGRDPQPVPPRDRRRADRARGRRPPPPDVRQRRAAEADRGREHGLLVRRRGRRRAPRDAVLRDVRQPRHLPQGLDRGDQAPHAVGDGRGRQAAGVRRRRLGALRHRPPTGRRRTTSRARTRRSCTSSSGCG